MDAARAWETSETSSSTYGTLERDVGDYARVARDVEALRAMCLAEPPGERGRAEGEEAANARTRLPGGSVGKRAVSARGGGGNRELMDLFGRARAEARGRGGRGGRGGGKVVDGRDRAPWHANGLHRRFNVAIGALLDELAAHEDSTPFLIAVDERIVPDYYQVIERPVAVATMREKLANGEYLSKDAFMEDLRLMEANAVAYNGENSVIARMARAVVGRGEELLAHMPRVDFVTCARAAEYAESLEAVSDAVTTDFDADDAYGEDEDDEETAAWRARTLAARVRRVFRAKAFEGLPIGSRRACAPRTAQSMDAFMRCSEDHPSSWPADDWTNLSRRPEDEDFVRAAVPAAPRYDAAASVFTADAARDELSARSIAIAIDDSRQSPALRALERSMTNVAATTLGVLAVDCATRVARAVADALATGRSTPDASERSTYLHFERANGESAPARALSALDPSDARTLARAALAALARPHSPTRASAAVAALERRKRP